MKTISRLAQLRARRARIVCIYVRRELTRAKIALRAFGSRAIPSFAVDAFTRAAAEARSAIYHRFRRPRWTDHIRPLRLACTGGHDLCGLVSPNPDCPHCELR